MYIHEKAFDPLIFNKTTNSIENERIDNDHFWNPNNLDNKYYKIHDNLISKKKINEINIFCKKYNWTYTQESISTGTKNIFTTHEKFKTMYENHWNKNISFTFFKVDQYSSLYMYNLFHDSILPKLDCIEDKANIYISRAYFNSHTLGSCGSLHKDGKPLSHMKPNKVQYTVLLFVNNDWDINFNGETAFLLNDNLIDTMVHIHSKPGRIVVFASDISHKACEISTYSLQSNRQRFVFAYHLYYADYKQLHAISN